MMSDKERCSALVFDSQMPFGHKWRLCSRSAAVERDDKCYCRQHDPEASKARHRVSYEKLKSEIARRRLEIAAPDLLAACKAAYVWLEMSRSRNPYEVMGLLRAAITKAEGGQP